MKFRKLFAVLMMLAITLVSTGVANASSHKLESTGYDILDDFINNSKFTAGVSWGNGKRPGLTSYRCQGCCAYTVDYVKYCYGCNQPRTGTVFKDVNDIRPGDVLTVGNQSNGNGHWFICLKRDGDKLYTAEGNWQNKVRIGWNYTISGKGFAEDRRSFTAGYHYLDKTPDLTGSMVPESSPESHEHSYKIGVIKKATLHSNGILKKKCTTCGKQCKETIYRLKKVKISKPEITSDGNESKPEVIVKDDKGTVIAPKYYKVTFKMDNRTGKAKATVVFRKKYSGKKSLKFDFTADSEESAESTPTSPEQ